MSMDCTITVCNSDSPGKRLRITYVRNVKSYGFRMSGFILVKIAIMRFIWKKSIIAMKGFPFTRKTEFATIIAASLKCPALSLDDVLTILNPTSLQTAPSSTNSTPQDFAFQIICQIAKSHLSSGLFDNIVIDSPLSSRSHLDQLIDLASSLSHTQLIIVECKPQNIYLMQTKFDEYLKENPNLTRNWYQAKDWEDVEKAIRDNYDERSDGYKVSKLVLDPMSDYQYYHLNSPLMLSQQLFSPPPFVEAVKYMMNRNEGEGQDLVVYREWRQSQYFPPFPYMMSYGSGAESSKSSKKPWFCKIGHSITNYTENGLELKADCLACGKLVNGAAYTCKDCSLALHKECAESFDRPSTWGNPCPDLKFRFQYRFPERLACVSCKEEGKSFSEYCESCIFETHLKCRLMPTVIRDDCHKEHFLSISLPNVNSYQLVFQCEACGESGRYNLYLCKICNVAYHYKCLTEVPRKVMHEHGGHHHQMKLEFSSEEGEEDYICLVCVENVDPDRRDPKCWFYSCEECEFVAHLYCIHPK
ncbi:hypothetical protein V2J09_002799 [Rumex salicifolius]